MVERSREEWLLHARSRAVRVPAGFVADGDRTLLAFSHEHRKAWRAHDECPCRYSKEYGAAIAQGGDLLRYMEETHLVPGGFVVVRREPGCLLLDGPGVRERDPAPLYRALRHPPGRCGPDRDQAR